MVLLRAASNKAVAMKGGNGERLLRLLLAGIGDRPLHHDDKLRDCEEGRMYGCTPQQAGRPEELSQCRCRGLEGPGT